MAPSCRRRCGLLLFALFAVLSLLAAGCGDDADVSTDSTTQTTTSTSAPSSTSTSNTSSSTTSMPPAEPIPDDELPGEDFVLTPAAGSTLAAVGIRFDEVLEVQLVPGPDADLVASLDAVAADFVASGRARLVARSIWWEVTTAEGALGWVDSRYTARTGPTFDTTADVIGTLGERPERATMSELGRLVAETVPTDPDVPTDIVMSVGADESGDVGEVTFDVIGLADDTLRGKRIHVFGQPLEAGPGFGLMAVEATDLCDPVRGPSEPDGLCA